MDFIVISFYRYTHIANPEGLCNDLKELCRTSKILGRILIAEEGINGAVCGPSASITKFKDYMDNIALFKDLTFREQTYPKNSYHKLVVKVRPEICSFKAKVDPRNSAPYITPSELDALYQHQEDFIMVDARNDYEYEVGKFRNAVSVDIHNFREFADAAQKLESQKSKKIILYCTGGIRCEKASAYLQEQQYPNVFHLKGGIIEYLNFKNKNQNVADTSNQDNNRNNNNNNNNWEGGLFVFDDRLVSPSDKVITTCRHCGTPAAQYYNCTNLDCDTLFISCSLCLEKYNKCCSSSCQDAPRKRKELPRFELKGTVENFYPKKQIAYIKASATIRIGQEVLIKGKTTNAITSITNILNDKGVAIEMAEPNEYVTIEIHTLARKNDKIYVPI